MSGFGRVRVLFLSFEWGSDRSLSVRPLQRRDLRCHSPRSWAEPKRYLIVNVGGSSRYEKD